MGALLHCVPQCHCLVNSGKQQQQQQQQKLPLGAQSICWKTPPRLSFHQFQLSNTAIGMGAPLLRLLFLFCHFFDFSSSLGVSRAVVLHHHHRHHHRHHLHYYRHHSPRAMLQKKKKKRQNTNSLKDSEASFPTLIISIIRKASLVGSVPANTVFANILVVVSPINRT